MIVLLEVLILRCSLVLDFLKIGQYLTKQCLRSRLTLRKRFAT